MPTSLPAKQPTSLSTLMVAFLLQASCLVGLLWFTPRTDFVAVIAWFLGMFAAYLWVMNQLPRWDTIKGVLAAGVLLRFLAFWALPELSNDYFRFLWDGSLTVYGENPFLSLPSEITADPARLAALGLDNDWFQALNSPEYYTIYPPVLQMLFALGAWLAEGDLYEGVLVLKASIFLAEVGSLWMMLRLLKRWKLPLHWLGWYALNPLVIAEWSGNLHFEALMIFFLLWSIDLLSQEKWQLASFPFFLAVATKLLPLMLMPLLIRRLGWKRVFIFGSIVGSLFLISFIPFFSSSIADWPAELLQTLQNIRQSFSLYVEVFEFNASLWYVIRAIGFGLVGWNVIHQVGPFLSLIIIVGIFVYSFREKRPDWPGLPASMMWVFLGYFALATIVHPWYACSLVAMSVFTTFRYPVVWTVFLPFTYATYRTDLYEENLWWVALEYLILLGWILWELKQIRRNGVRNLGPT
ncbi:MAG: glycosyltransferase 87 family protein [Bacteroidota bacterium]